MLLRSMFLAAAVVPALANAEVSQIRYVSTIAAVNEQTNVLIFTDRSQTVVDPSITVTREMIGKTVEIGQDGDEDGWDPAKTIRILN